MFVAQCRSRLLEAIYTSFMPFVEVGKDSRGSEATSLPHFDVFCIFCMSISKHTQVSTVWNGMRAILQVNAH